MSLIELFFSCVFLCADHIRDAARAENALTLTYGTELIGMQRDWNEELQSCREFPHTTPQERYISCRVANVIVHVIFLLLHFSFLVFGLH